MLGQTGGENIQEGFQYGCFEESLNTSFDLRYTRVRTKLVA